MTEINKFLASGAGIVDVKSAYTQTRVGGTVTDGSVVNLTKSILVGKDTSGGYAPVEVDPEGHMRIAIHDPTSVFGEVLVAENQPVAQHTFHHGPVLNNRLWYTTTVNTGTCTSANSMATVSSGTTTGSTALLESRKKIKYRAGEGVIWRGTMRFETSVAGTTQIIGVGTAENGFFFGYNGTAFGVLHRNDSVDTWYPQTAWNYDKADGTGAVQNINWDTLTIGEIDIGYLGSANVTFRLYDNNINHSEFSVVHRLQFASIITVPHLSDSSLPMCMYVDNGATTTDLIIHSGSMMLAIQGANKKDGFTNSLVNTKSAISTTETNILTIQARSTFQGTTNYDTVYPISLSVGLNGNNKSNIIRLILGTTLGGTPSYTNVDTNHSTLAYDTAGTTITGGSVLATYVLGKDGNQTVDLEKIKLFLEPGETLTISSEATAADNAEVTASLMCLEDL